MKPREMFKVLHPYHHEGLLLKKMLWDRRNSSIPGKQNNEERKSLVLMPSSMKVFQRQGFVRRTENRLV